MPKRRSDDSFCDDSDDDSIPLPIQTFLWRQTSPFIRPKISRLQDAAAMEQREACKSFEKVLVQNIQFGLSPSLTEAIRSISRWRLIVAALPHVMHCGAALLYGRRNSTFDKLSAAETKLLYTLHWILLDAAEECADAECEQGLIRRPEHYLLPITTIQVFVYLFGPLIPRLRNSDFLTSFRLENGHKIWSPLFQHQHPDIPSFTAQVKPKRNILRATRHEKKTSAKFGDVFLGVSDSNRRETPTPSMNSFLSDERTPVPTPTPTPIPMATPTPVLTTSSASMERLEGKESVTPTKRPLEQIDVKALADPAMATYLDVAVLRCLFTSQWLEEGIEWALNFLLHRLKSINTDPNKDKQRPRSSSLPIASLPKKDNDYVETDLRTDPIPKLTVQCDQSPNRSFQELRRSSFSGGLSGLAGLISPGSLPIGRTASEKVKSPKRQKKNNKTTEKTASDQNLDKMPREDLFVSNKLKPKTDFLSSESSISSKHKDLMPPPRPKSALGTYADTRGSQVTAQELQRGRSMPSLHLILSSERSLLDVKKSPKKSAAQTHSVPYPIITITEHSPVTSIHFFVSQEPTADSPKESVFESLLATAAALDRGRGSGLTRSQTDSDISYFAETPTEAPAAANYVTKNGHLSLAVVLKAVHAIALKESVCSLHVCQSLHAILQRLIQMGALPLFIQPFTGDDTEKTGGQKESDELSVHALFMDSLMRLVKRVGCPHGCSEGHREIAAQELKREMTVTLEYLFHASESQFSHFFEEMVQRRNVQEIVDIFHAFLGFCAENHTQTRKQSLGCPLTTSGVASTADVTSGQVRTGYSTNFGAGFGKVGPKGIEGVIIQCIFKPLVSRLTAMAKELKVQENLSLYADIRQLIAYVRDQHGGTFRKVALSGLIDSSQLIQTKREPRDKDKDRSGQYSPTQPEQEDKTHSKKFFKKKSSSAGIKSAASSQSIHEDSPALSESWPLPGTQLVHTSGLRVQRSVSPRLSITDTDDAVMIQLQKQVKAGKSFSLANWFRSGQQTKDDAQVLVETNGHSLALVTASSEPSSDKMVRRASFSRQQTIKGQQKHSTFGKAKKRMEDQFRFVFGKSKAKHGSFEDTPDLSRRNSFDFSRADHETSDLLLVRESRLVSVPALRDGMIRFQFLLEACTPGTLPDAPLVAAMLDIRAPVVARAAFFIECAHFVHRCNRGLWPQWMRHNFNLFRPSAPGTARCSQSVAIRGRASNALQRSAGRAFFSWAEVLSLRLEELLQNEINAEKSGQRSRNVCEDEREEDFLDEAFVNPSGNECPLALKLVACHLLFEITAFMRETHQYLPTRSSRSSVRERTSNFGEPRPAQVANRRWSMALTNVTPGEPLLHSLGERRISFVLQEADQEDESNSSVSAADETAGATDKKRLSNAGPPGRPHLLRRSTGGSGGHGSFKRRSIKLKKERKKDGARHRSSTLVEDDEADGRHPFRRSDSLRSRRKVSGVSERSDTSERVSGDESPGVLSDDGQMPDTPQSDLDQDDQEMTQHIPWLKLVTTFKSLLQFQCPHLNKCHHNCHRRAQRSVQRLLRSVVKVYSTAEDRATELNTPEWLGLRTEDKEDAAKKEKRLKKMVTTGPSGPSSPVRRKISVGEGHVTGHHSIHSSTTYLAHNIDLEAAHAHSDESDARRLFAEVSGQPRREDNPSTKFITAQMKNSLHALLSMLLKGALVLRAQHDFDEWLTLAWQLVLEDDPEVSSAAAVSVIVCALKSPAAVSELLERELTIDDPTRRSTAINKFHAIWRNRFQFWPRLEDGAHLYLKVPPPSIEFTLPSPRIALETMPVVDPPYMPVSKSKVEEVTISQEPQIQRSFVAATKTRRKQQIELVAKALQEEEDRLREERENFRISAVPITLQAAYEPALFHNLPEGEETGEEGEERAERPSHHIQAAQAVFPSALCSAAVTIINLLDDPQVARDGSAVYEVAYKVVWHCLVEDPALFLRHFLERLTREKQETVFQILRRLIRFMPRLPAQAAFTLYNFLIGFVMLQVRAPAENSQSLVATVLSILWLVVPSVHGLFLKDLKQVLRKEQCDASLLITANVPSAKKIIVHGPDQSVIPSQFPIHEDTQFSQILTDSLDFFGIDENQHQEYFLVDSKTNQMHNLNAFVRDFYFFKRSQYPQISLVHINPEEAFLRLQRQAFTLQFVELGKTLMSFALIKSSFLGTQRVLFLHEELMKLPSFPRKALEANFALYSRDSPEVLAMDTLHKIVWVKLVGKMFEATQGFFAQSQDVHLFLNVVNGALILHCENAAMLRLCMATYINAAHQFRNIFAANGYLLIIPTLCRIYSNHQTNQLLCRTIEFVCKQFYVLHRKPFVLQMFGAVAPLLDLDLTATFGDAAKVQPRAFFQLLQSLEKYIVDPLDILELVEAEKPLKALDFCYQMDAETLTVLDAISLCVTVVSYAADTERGQQMLTILEAILPLHLKHMQSLTTKKETPGGPRTELQMIHNVSVCMKTLIYNCEALTRNFTGPQRAIDLRGSSVKKGSKGAYSPPVEIDDDSHSNVHPSGGQRHSEYYSSRARSNFDQYSSDGEFMRADFRRPRDVLLKVVAEFLSRSTARLHDLSKKLPDLHQKGSSYELLDVRCHLRLAEVAHSLLKMAPYDPQTMASRGLVRYMLEILPNSEWRQEQMRPALIMVLRRLDKTFTKIAKKTAIKRQTDWEAARRLLKGVYLTFVKHPYIVHLPHLKSLIQVCQSIVLGDHSHQESQSTLPQWAVALSQSSPPGFTSVAVRLIALQMLQLGDSQSLETVCQSALSSPEKAEIYLMNLIYPLCIRISSGLKEVPRLRQCDIVFALTLVLSTLKPIAVKSSKGSDSSSGAHMQHSLHQVGFLGLKILMACFERQLTTEWHRIARTVRELGTKMQGGVQMWAFLDYVVTYRTPLFLLLFPVIKCKYLLKICDNDQEYQFQQQIKDKLKGQSLPQNRSKGQLLVSLMSEMRVLRDELISRKHVTHDERHKSIVPDMATGGSDQNPRLSFAMQMPSKQSTNQSEEASAATPSSRHSLLRGLSFRLSAREPRTLRNLSVKMAEKRSQELRRTSYPEREEQRPELKTTESAQSEPKLFRKSTLHLRRDSKKKSRSKNSSKNSDSFEALVEGVTTDDQKSISRQLSRGEEPPKKTEDSVAEDEESGDRHRLQRQKASLYSRKTFRFRKSRRGLRAEGAETGEQRAELELSLLSGDQEVAPVAEEESSSVVERSREEREGSSDELNEWSALLGGAEGEAGGEEVPFADED